MDLVEHLFVMKNKNKIKLMRPLTIAKVINLGEFNPLNLNIKHPLGPELKVNFLLSSQIKLNYMLETLIKNLHSAQQT